MPTNDPSRTIPRQPVPEQTADHVPVGDTSTPGDSSPDAPTPGTAVRTPADVERLEAGAKDSAVAVPGYEVLGVLGRGGMGVVYKARQVKLNRIVALKMMLGERVGRSELIRFLAEAESVAAIKHENVVQVFDSGEADGRPFMALEYLPGASLAQMLDSRRESVSPSASSRESARLLAQVARGVAAAHAQGTVHRDLKPANVLFDEDGTPKVSDFGLAKRGEGSGETETGVVMGTLAYMSPEQAKGESKFAGPQADVWALGVILYEAFTGTRPFRGDRKEILAQILTADPVPPRKLAPALPRDLELICLKCLAKESHERYPTAKELADDLDRYLRHEPISVRPAGPIERAYKSVKRNPVISGAAAAVFLALTIGIGVAIVFGLDAKDKEKLAKDEAGQRKIAADRADSEAGQAKISEAKAIQKGNELAEANTNLKLANDRTNAAFARRLIAPLRPRQPLREPLVPLEVETFQELASLRGTPLSYTFLDEATQKPTTSKQLDNRARFALHAAIGLDPKSRDAAEELFLSRLDAPGTTPGQRLSLALACSHLGSLSPGAAERVARILADEIAATADLYALGHLADRLSAAAEKMEPDRAAKLCAEAARRLNAARDGSVDELILPGSLMGGLSRLAERMGPNAAAALLADAMGKNKNPDPLSQSYLAQGLATAAARMEPGAGAAILIEALINATDAMVQSELVKGLASLAPRMGPEAAAVAAKKLADAVDKAREPFPLAPLARGLSAVAARMESGQAARTCEPAARKLADAMAKPSDPFTQMNLAMALAAVTAWVDPGVAAETCDAAVEKLLDALNMPSGMGGPGPLAAGIAALAPRLDRDSAAKTRDAAAGRLLKAMEGTTVPYALMDLAMGLSAVAAGMEPARAAEVCDAAAKKLLDAMNAVQNPGELNPLVAGVAALAARMEPGRAAKACAAAVNALRLADARPNTTPFPAQPQTPMTLPRLAPWMEPPRAAELLIDAIHSAGQPRLAKDLVRTLSAVTHGTTPESLKHGSVAAVRAAGAFAGPNGLLPGLPLLHPTVQPQVRPLPPEGLVELLKHPFCVGEARRAVLDALAFTYNRPFADQWEFVEYARKHQPHLDLLSPPKRPQL